MNFGIKGAIISWLVPSGALISKTIIVIMIAITPSLKASNLVLFIYITCATLSRFMNLPYPFSIKHLLLSIATSPLNKTVFTFPVNSQPS